MKYTPAVTLAGDLAVQEATNLRSMTIEKDHILLAILKLLLHSIDQCSNEACKAFHYLKIDENSLSDTISNKQALSSLFIVTTDPRLN